MLSKEILFCDITSMLFKDDWTQLVSRKKGEELLSKLKERINADTKIIILDFSMVNKVDKSFIDIFLLPLLREFKNEKIIIGVNIKKYMFEKTKTLKDAELEDIDDFLRKKNEEFLVIDEEKCPHLLGTGNINANIILSCLLKCESLTYEQICFELDKKSQEIESSINYLLDKSFIIQMASKDYKYKSYKIKYRERILPYIGITIDHLVKEKYDKIIESGHFELPSGVHVDKLFHVSQLLKDSRLTRKIGSYFADLFGNNIDFVLSTETPNNIILAHRIAQSIGRDTRVIFALLSGYEKKFILHDGFKIKKGENGLISIDVVTTGMITNLLIDLLMRNGINIRGICSIFDLSGGSTYFPPFIYRSMLQESISIYQKDNCQLCKDGLALFRPKIIPGDWKW